MIRAADGGVAGNVASCEPAFLQNRNVGETMILCKVIGSCKSMTATSHYYCIVGFLRLHRFPQLWWLLRKRGCSPSSDSARRQSIVRVHHDFNRVICGSYCGSCPTVAG